jgi:predicted metal-binding membrane protein
VERADTRRVAPARACAREPVKPIGHRDVFVPFLAGLIALAWIVLWLWERSPYGRYLAHGELGGLHSGDSQHALAQAAVYVTAWMLMTAAMMLPTTLPLIEIFRRMTRQRADRAQLAVLLIVGYLGVWLAFGVGAHVFDLGLHEAFERVEWLHHSAWLFGAGSLLVAGAFQFSSLKYRCLEKCRAPLAFVVAHWRGDDSRLQALRLGAHHGVYCVGCCWALMLLMFAVGTGSVGWMLALGAIMAIEKNLPWGRRLSVPLGIALLTWGGLIAFDHVWSWQA